MKKLIVFIVLLSLQSCWICPEKQSIEFKNSTKSIKVLNDNYYIKSIKIVEFIPKEGYIEPIDSNYVEFVQIGARGASELSLFDISENYLNKSSKISNLKLFLNKQNLAYTIYIEKFENKKNGDLDIDHIYFISDEMKNDINIFESNHPCP
ncbi:hypothetical protein [Flavobacterium okayamense]|uniref:Lipoprotein n=1 Tax=Flavobacterium okayamense TaxID=2830782 RepID=A0ABM7S7G7_9FLAO|nr:hypothetical protein [Flavobacterium okayamense]BCY28873.1 hypothetical protein KK2020170_17410 [Flavobacterium okayamense]